MKNNMQTGCEVSYSPCGDGGNLNPKTEPRMQTLSTTLLRYIGSFELGKLL